VNKTFPKGARLEQALLKTLNEILGEIAWASRSANLPNAAQYGPDATIRLVTESGTPATLSLHVESELRPNAFSAWAARHEDGSRNNAAPVLAMPFVSARIAELCRRAGWSWLDLAGNCWLDVPGRLHIERTGNPPVHRPPRRGANLSTAAAARVMRVLLSPEHAGRSWTQRDLQTQTCWHLPGERPISLGLVNKVLRHLRDERYVTMAGADSEERGVKMQDPESLLKAWCEAYRFKRHERRSYFTLLKRAELDRTLAQVATEAGGMAKYAVFSAAERQAPQVRQPKTWVYVAAQFIDTLAKHTQAKEVESGENLVVLIPDDPGVFLFSESQAFVGEQAMSCTNPVQTYVDLMHCGGRGEEAAQAVLEQRILPMWKSADHA